MKGVLGKNAAQRRSRSFNQEFNNRSSLDLSDQKRAN